MALVALGLLATGLAQAAPRETPPPTPSANVRTAKVSWKKFRGDGFLFDPAGEPLCDVVMAAAASPAPHSILVGGRLRCPSSGSRSFLLRSADSGRSWTELGTAIRGRSASHFSFVDSRRGFLLITHHEEGPGPDSLFATEDGGKTWREVREVPKGASPHLAPVESFSFDNRREGRIRIRLFSGDHPDLHVTLATHDGGRHWEFWEAAPATTPTPAAAESPLPEGSPAPAAAQRSPATWQVEATQEAWIVRRNQGRDALEVARLPLQVRFVDVAHSRTK